MYQLSISSSLSVLLYVLILLCLIWKACCWCRHSFFSPRVMTRPLCFNLLLSLPEPCFVSLLPLVLFRSYPFFPFVPILILFPSYPCFLPFPSIVSLASIRLLLFPCGLSLPLCLRLAVLILSVLDAGCWLLSFCSRFNTLRFVPWLYSFAFPTKRNGLQLKAKTRTPYCLSPTPDVVCGKLKVFSLLALRSVARCVMQFNALCFACAALILVWV